MIIISVTQSVLIVIVYAILIFLAHKTKYPYLLPMVLNVLYLYLMFKILPILKLADMETEGTILAGGFMIIGLIDVIFTNLNSKK